jgi:hypothetical protein
MIGHAASAKAFTVLVTGHGCEIGMKARKDGWVPDRSTVFGAEDDVN